MATPEQRTSLRRDTGTPNMPDADADAFYTEAWLRYGENAAGDAYARVLVLRGMLASSAQMASYRQNESQENLSDVYKNLRDLFGYWQGEVGTGMSTGGAGGVRSGRTVTKPPRIKEYPNDGHWPVAW